MSKTIIKGYMWHDPVQGTLIRNARVDRPDTIETTESVDLSLELKPYMYKHVVITIEDED